MVWIEHWIWIAICPLLAYFIGAIPFSYIVTKKRTGLDLRTVGTKNVGGLNTMIQSGFNWGMLAGFLDFSKGLVCLIIILIIPFSNSPLAGAGKYWEISQHDLIYIFVAIAIILGHNYPIYLKFQGGRGIAAAIGFLVIVNPIILTIFIVSMTIFLLIIKYNRPSQFLALFVGAPVAFFLNFYPPWIFLTGMNNTFVQGLFVLGIALAIFPKYLSAFIDMFKGKEYRIGKTGGLILQEEKHQE